MGGVNGALPAAQVVAEETARLAGGAAAVDEHMRLFELGDLVLPAAPPGRLRSATRDDAELCLAWFRAFAQEAAEQAGRDRAARHGGVAMDEMLARIDDGVVWLWEDEAGEVVHLTGANLPSYGVTRIGPVYTPREQRGRGYAAAPSPRSRSGTSSRGCAAASSPTRPTRPPTRSTRRSATARSSTWSNLVIS